MKVKEIIEYLQQFNPEATVYSQINYSPFPPRIAFGSREGCTPANCDEVFIYVDEDEEKENEK